MYVYRPSDDDYAAEDWLQVDKAGIPIPQSTNS
jgi:hypothetical protein